MRRRLFGLATIVALLTAFGLCEPASASTAAKVYRGRATVVVETYDYCSGARRIADRSRFSTTAELHVVPRLSGDGRTERNPFGWQFYVGNVGQPGSFQFASAFLVGPRRYLAEYWNTGRSSTGQFNGRLVQSHSNIGAAWNQFMANKPLVDCRPNLGVMLFPFAVAAGARINGVVTNGAARFTLIGATEESLYAFRIDFNA
ncbi:hypothetical protein [Microtetraspora niveoalba]|uniref:hypothetical protein n=1 Tax=Microtetraspora niveoalba TaxID=46175 RepID=UPI00082B71AE|nr:hypothetical protein [Microtetraspora niveoalba]